MGLVDSLTPDTVQRAILFLIALIMSIAVHEFGHAWAATKLGDPLPASQGRLTLNPLRHADPIGTVVFPLVAFFGAIPLLGWGKPVQTNPAAYTRRYPRATAHMMVAVAGPAMNLLLMVVTSLVMVALLRAEVVDNGFFMTVEAYLIRLNFTLMVFNLLPIPPLDGGSVLAGLLPPSMQGVIDVLSRWGMLVLLGLMFIPGMLGQVLAPAFYLYDHWMRLVITLLMV